MVGRNNRGSALLRIHRSVTTIPRLRISLDAIFIRAEAQSFVLDIKEEIKDFPTLPRPCSLYSIDKMCKYIQDKANKSSKDEKETIVETHGQTSK